MKSTLSPKSEYETRLDEVLATFRKAIENQAEFLARKDLSPTIKRKHIDRAAIEILNPGCIGWPDHAMNEVQSIIDLVRE